ncbi:GAF domain-containing protein, partial [Acidobacteriia bacterium AH_259_A11_L15]|nr:GAF domain-containing protein [Acidobacteriia bacterium AH_259_A11_L15]
HQPLRVHLGDEVERAIHVFVLRYDERIERKGGMRLGTGLTGTAAALRQSIRSPNVQLDPRYVTCGDAVDAHSELVVPLVVKDRLVGVLDLESTEYNAFTEQHEELLSTLASYIAIALENARLYEKLREEERRLEVEDVPAQLLGRLVAHG